MGKILFRARQDWRKLRNRINDVSILKKLILSYILVVLVPVLLVGSILTNTMYRLALDQAVNEAHYSVERIKKRVLEALRVSMIVANKYYLDRNLEEVLERSFTSTWEVVNAYRNQLTLDEFPNLYSEIILVRVYATNPTLLDSWNVMKVTPEIQETDWYQRALSSKGRVSWHYIHFPETGKSFFTLYRSITATKPLGVLTVSLNPEHLFNILRQESFETMLIDEFGNIVAASDRTLVGSTASAVNLDGITVGENILRELEYRGEVYQVIADPISLAPNYGRLQIVSLFPVEAIVARAKRANRLGMTIIGLSLALSFGLILVFSRFLTKRILLLKTGAHRIAAGDLDYSLAIAGRDEIGQLSKHLNQMVQSIKRLLAENYQVKLEKKQLEIEQRDIKLNMLANQMNPHFLFNVLETIRMKAHSRGESELAQIVKTLGKLLRRNLETGSELTTLEAELSLVVDYLALQKFRFGDKLEYQIRVAEEAKTFPLLPLTIQPLVENAVVHGLEKKEGKGRVWVDVSRSGDYLSILVRDDGVGMSAAAIEAVQRLLGEEAGEPGKHIGLKNLQQRLKLFYRDDYGLRISSRLHQGTEVEVRLPWRGEASV